MFVVTKDTLNIFENLQHALFYNVFYRSLFDVFNQVTMAHEEKYLWWYQPTLNRNQYNIGALMENTHPPLIIDWLTLLHSTRPRQRSRLHTRRRGSDPHVSKHLTCLLLKWLIKWTRKWKEDGYCLLVQKEQIERRQIYNVSTLY